jgi:hypothetical protein
MHYSRSIPLHLPIRRERPLTTTRIVRSFLRGEWGVSSFEQQSPSSSPDSYVICGLTTNHSSFMHHVFLFFPQQFSLCQRPMLSRILDLRCPLYFLRRLMAERQMLRREAYSIV